MEQIQSYDRLASLLAAQLRPGVVTNAVLGRGDYLPEIEAGALFVEPFPGGLLIFRRRKAHQLLNFYLQRGACLPGFRPRRTTVLEIATRARDTALQAAAAQWVAAGFRPLFSRQRMTRPAGPGPGVAPPAVHVATPAELPEICRLLDSCFDPLTGCIPPQAALAAQVEAGWVLTAPGGLLHMAKAPAGTELRHLAVDKPLRRRGIAQALFDAYLAKTDNGASRVWVRQDNPPALGFYAKNGYVCDGWTSLVYAAGKDG